MKSATTFPPVEIVPSLPVRGAWIEMPNISLGIHLCRSLPVRGAWIEIKLSGSTKRRKACRSPCGERGLK